MLMYSMATGSAERSKMIAEHQRQPTEEWFYTNGTEVIGPFAENRLMTLVKSSVLTQDTLVWSPFLATEEGWQRARDTKLNSIFE